MFTTVFKAKGTCEQSHLVDLFWFSWAAPVVEVRTITGCGGVSVEGLVLTLLFVDLQGLMELQMVLPTPDSDEKNGLNLLRRLWVVKFDREDEIRKLAERYHWWHCHHLPLSFERLCSSLLQQ